MAEGIQVSRQGNSNKYPECAVKNDDDEEEELRRQPRWAICSVSLANIPPKIASKQPRGLH